MSLGRRKNGAGPGPGQGSLGNSKVAYSSPRLNISCPTLFSEKFISVGLQKPNTHCGFRGRVGQRSAGPKDPGEVPGSPLMTRGCNL